MTRLAALIGSAGLLLGGPGCKVRSVRTNAPEASLADSEAGLVVLFAPARRDDVCSVVCDGERIARAYAARLPLDATALCTNLMRCAAVASVAPLASKIDACFGKTAATRGILDAVRAQNLSRPDGERAASPCDADVAVLVDAIGRERREQISGAVVAQLNAQLAASTDTALGWLAMRHYLTDGEAAAKAPDPAALANAMNVQDNVVRLKDAAQSSAGKVATVAAAVQAMRGLTARLGSTIAQTQAAKQAAERSARLEAEAKAVRDREEVSRSSAMVARLRAAGDRFIYREPGDSAKGALLVYDKERGFDYHAWGPFSGRTYDDSWAPSHYDCYYATCSDGLGNIRIDDDARGFVLERRGYHFRVMD
jgi:hypothetical protein